MPTKVFVIRETSRAAFFAVSAFLLVMAASDATAQAKLKATTTKALKLHVPSPDWRDQIIYFVMTDRFDDGNPANNNQGAGEFDPSDKSRYSGGDLAGVSRRLEYIKGLGATAVWVTPPVRNQWLNVSANYGGYHGYWASHFKQMDPHVGTLREYQQLSHDLHSKGMYLIQDIVLNHTGDFFSYTKRPLAADPANGYKPNLGSRPTLAPTQAPFNLNDPRRAADRRAGIYHWTPDIADYNRREQELNDQLSGLDDLNTENPKVRRALRDSHGYWIKSVGVDAFRIDTVFYVPPETFTDFMYSSDKAAPGMNQLAARTGRRDFHVFGEGFAIDKPFADTLARKVETYATQVGGKPILPGMLNFPLYGSLNNVFAGGQATAQLAHRIGNMMRTHRAPHLMPTFVDNHDVDRFLAGGSDAGLRQALVAMMTLPGIPTLYYGSEQGFKAQRASMFRSGWGSQGRDWFDTSAPLYAFTARATAMRRAHPVLSRGVPTVLQSNPSGAGIIAWRMSADDSHALVVLNTSDAPALADNLALPLPAGAKLAGVMGLERAPDGLALDARSSASVTLPAKGFGVWVYDKQLPVAANQTGNLPMQVNALEKADLTGDLQLSGIAKPMQSLQIVVDGDLASATAVIADSGGRWQVTVDTSGMVVPGIKHRALAWDAVSQTASNAVEFTVARQWERVADVVDPVGDDVGRNKNITYPTDPSYGARRQMDLRRVQVWRSGTALRVDVSTNELTRVWSPQNGFDHVAFTLFIEVPGRGGGADVMPLQNGKLPEGMRWHHRLRAHGWSNAMFGESGASATVEGTPSTRTAALSTDPATNTVSFLIPPNAIGNPITTRGLKLYLNTWDYDGGYRLLGDQAGPYVMGGPKSEAWVIDETPVIVLP